MAMPCEIGAEKPVVDAARVGDRAAFERLVRDNRRWVNAVIFGVLGDRDRLDDVAQQVWKTVWSRIADLRDSGQWRSWLYRIARNAALDSGRSATRRKRLVEQVVRLPGVEASSAPEADAINEERRRIVLDAVRSLPALYREPFVLRHLEGWPYQQIGEAMGLPVATVETRLVRARQKLRSALAGKV